MTLDRLVQMHLEEALQLAIRLSGQVDAAEEIVQEALLKVSKSWTSFRGESAFRTWLYRIVINAFRDWLRQKEQAVSINFLETPPPDPKATRPESAVLRTEFQEFVAKRISALPPRQREVLILIIYEDLSPTETAEVLGMTEANVHSTLHIARARLRRELTPYLVEK